MAAKLNIYSVLNVDGDCEWQGAARSKSEALRVYKKECGVRQRGDYAVALIPKDQLPTTRRGVEDWFAGFCYAMGERE